MSIAHRFNSLLHLSLALSVLAFATADAKPLLALLGLSVIGLCWFLTRGRRISNPPALPRFGINILVLAAIANAAMSAPGRPGDEIVSILGRFLVFVVLIKLFDRRAIRDDAQLITLSVFIAIASILTGTQFLVGILLVVYVPITVAAAMYWQIHAGSTLVAQAVAADSAGSSSPIDAPLPRIPTSPNARRGFIGLCLTSVLSASAIATVIFVLVPRGIGGDFLGRFGMIRQPQIGFREAVKLGEAGFLKDDPTPVLDLQITSPTGGNLGAAGVTWYLRGGARDKYDPGAMVWQDAGPKPTSVDLPTETTWQPQWESGPSDRSTSTSSVTRRIQKITMRGESMGHNIFCLWRPLGFTPDRPTTVQFSRRNGTLHRTESAGARFTYTIDSVVFDDLMRAPISPTDFQTGEIKKLADRILADRNIAPDPNLEHSRQIALALRDHLRDSFQYTLELVAPPENRDAIEFFLFDRKQGHCEYFASAMAAMCQSQGIPARVVTGYLVTDYNSLTGQYLVRESDAHAWVEAFITTEPETGRGRWENFDASPPGEIERIHRPPSGVFASIRGWYEALEFGWSSSVIAYDNSADRKTAARSLGTEADFAPRFLKVADKLVQWMKTARQDPRVIPWYIWSLPLLVVCAVLLVAAFPKIRGRYAPSREAAERRKSLGLSAHRPSGFYAKALRSLSRAGIPKPDSLPLARFADSLAPRSALAAKSLRTLADLYYRTRFGGQTLDQTQLATAEASIRDLDQALRQSAKTSAPS